MKKLHTFSVGRSGCPVSLIEYNGRPAVYKENLQDVNGILKIDSVMTLPTAKILAHSNTTITMEYLNGVSIKTFLESATRSDVYLLIDYIKQYFDFCIEHSEEKDFSDFIDTKVNSLKPYIDLSELNIQTNLYSGIVHGDFTFDNLIYKDGKFYMIDLSPSAHTGIHFDANKLRQDLTGKWFIRNEVNTHNIQTSCDTIFEELNKEYAFLFDDNLYKFMFARVLPYCKDENEKEFIRKAIG